jgi:hypothetical protein
MTFCEIDSLYSTEIASGSSACRESPPGVGHIGKPGSGSRPGSRQREQVPLPVRCRPGVHPNLGGHPHGRPRRPGHFGVLRRTDANKESRNPGIGLVLELDSLTGYIIEPRRPVFLPSWFPGFLIGFAPRQGILHPPALWATHRQLATEPRPSGHSRRWSSPSHRRTPAGAGASGTVGKDGVASPAPAMPPSVGSGAKSGIPHPSRSQHACHH